MRAPGTYDCKQFVWRFRPEDSARSRLCREDPLRCNARQRRVQCSALSRAFDLPFGVWCVGLDLRPAARQRQTCYVL